MNKRIRKTLIAWTIGTGALLFAAMPAQAEEVTVRPGDTLWRIAESAMISLTALMAANPNVDPLNLQIGSKLTLPGAVSAEPAGAYVVQGHETFWDISRKLGIPHASLVAANAHLDPLNLYHGLQIRLPSAGTATLAAHEQADTPKLAAAESVQPGTAKTAAEAQTVETVDGQVVAYKKALNVQASAYTAAAGENGPWGAVDYFGNALQLGTIAVDPDVIPFGSKLYITGYDHHGLPAKGMYGTASDTGGAIKGNRVDIFIPVSQKEALSFGLQNVTVYILE